MHGIRRATAVAEDLKQPRLESLSLLVSRQRPVQTNERFLHHVLGIVGVAQHGACEAKTSLIVRLNDRCERIDIAEFGSADRGGLERGRGWWNRTLQERARFSDLGAV